MTIIESLFKAKALDITTVGKFIEHSIKSLEYDFQDTVDTLINGVEIIKVDPKYLMIYHNNNGGGRTAIDVSNIVVNPFIKTIRFNVCYKTTKYYKTENCSGWDYESHQNDTYKYPKEVDDYSSYKISYKEYDDIVTLYNSNSPVEDKNEE